MTNILGSELISAINTYVGNHPEKTFSEVSNAIGKELNRLSESGSLALGNDKDLTGESLEIRVFLLLRDMGIPIDRGREGLEDFVAKAPENTTPNIPLAIEVKSNRKPCVTREHLRQLDDWVFDLSQEEMARKKGLGGKSDPVAMIHGGLMTTTHHHPTPHKGVLVFNAPVGMLFEQRISSPLGPDEIDFAIKRNFCVISIDALISASESIQQGHKNVLDIWQKIHETCGIFE